MSGERARTERKLVPTSATPFKKVRKRDGRLAEFDIEKITRAIARAGAATGEFSESVARGLTLRVLNLAQAAWEGDPTVEQIQDAVEEVLLTSTFKKTAKAYILYRDQHARLRELVKKADVDLIDSYLDRLDWKVKENSNMAYSLQGLNNYVASEISKGYWLNKIYPPEIRKAHEEGCFHLHDLGQLSVYCVGWDLRDLLMAGFKGAPGKAESLPAKHFRTALGQVVNFFYTLQGEAAGAQAFSNFDTYLAPFIRYDELDYRAVKQALQEFVFNLNVPTRVGFQTPFTNLTMDLKVPKTLRDEQVVVGGKLKKETYGEFQEELNLFNTAFLEVLSEGDAKGRVFTFPIPTYNIAADFDWEAPGLERLWEVTARYGIPYFANFVNSDLSPDDARSMCCRLRLDLRSLEKRGGGLFGANPLTGSTGVVTINMPRLGYESKDEPQFMAKLDELMDLAHASLDIKRKVLERFTEKNLYPYTKFYLRGVKKRFGHFWNNHFSTIGLVGMNEACRNLLGKDLGQSEAKEFAARVLDHMRDRLREFQEESGYHFNLEATPAEGAGFRLAGLDFERYPDIYQAGAPSVGGEHNSSLDSVAQPEEEEVSDTRKTGEFKRAEVSPEAQTADSEAQTAEETPEVVETPETRFYTNSTQLPVDYSEDIFKVLDLQDDLQRRYTGGTVLHVYLGEAVADPQAVKAFVRKVCQGYHLPYFTVTPTFSICPNHGYLRGQHRACPTCDEKTEVYSRVVGYLRPVDQWNGGKQAEFGVRSHYDRGVSKGPQGTPTSAPNPAPGDEA